MRIILLFALCLLGHTLSAQSSKDIEFAIVIPSYNNEKWVSRNLESIVLQKNQNWKLYYINDASIDRTKHLVEKFIESHHLQDKITLINNTQRKGALANLYSTIMTLKPTQVVVTVDGDDFLYNSRVLDILAKAYANPDVWMTYGNFTSSPKGWPSCCEEIPQKIAKNRSFRSYKWVSSHLRTFYAKLFQNIKKEDLLWHGKFFPMTWDMAFMFPMLEMASEGHFKFIKDITYIYNVRNPINDHRVNAQLQRDLETYIRKRPPYQALSELFTKQERSIHVKKRK
jgi:glycosyltransferase involved in cell wall biosynthesis